ncbi:MAG: hypothetical protein AB2L26_13610 [Ignavibacteria bacterium]
MNKYFFKIPYNYVRYGTLSCYVYEEEVMDLAYECENRNSEDYDDSDDSGDTEYQSSDMECEVEEEDVSVPHENNNSNNTPGFQNLKV